jgi:hypothetical protein
MMTVTRNELLCSVSRHRSSVSRESAMDFPVSESKQGLIKIFGYALLG